jgi:hypothetical protein
MYESLSTNLACNIYYSKLFTPSGYKSVSKTEGQEAYVTEKGSHSAIPSLADLETQAVKHYLVIQRRHLSCGDRER